MKIESRSSVESSNINNSTAFNIQAHAQAFQILSGAIYSNTIRAIIRELSCNAYDAHIAANKKDVPFKINLPNRMEPFFTVTDYGIGLSKESVMTLYSTYFQSTKTDSNDFVGAMGLGSKTPFSYTDSFTVTSWFDGVQYNFIAFVGDEGFPTFTFTGSKATDRCNGLEVKVPVKECDFHKFTSEASYVFATFETQPEGISFNYEEHKVKTKEFSGNTSGQYRTEFYAVQGNVRYNIHTDKFPDCFLKSFYKGNLYFDIGEVTPTASREELLYDAKTIKAITDKAKSISKTLIKEIHDKIDAQDDIISASLYARDEISLSYSTLTKYFNYKGEDLLNNSFSLSVRRNKELDIVYCRKKWGEWKREKVALRNHSVRYKDFSFNIDHNKVFVLIDEARYRDKIIKYSDDNGGDGVFCLFKYTDGDIRALKKLMPWMEIKKLSDMPFPEKSFFVREKRQYEKDSKVYKLKSYSAVAKNCFEKTDKNLSDIKGEYYVVIDRYKPESSYELSDLCYFMENHSQLIGKTLYAVKKKNADKAKELGGVSIDTKIEELRDSITEANYIEYLTSAELQSVKKDKTFATFGDTKPFNDIVKLLEKYTYNESDNSDINTVESLFGRLHPKAEPLHSRVSIIYDVVERYPIIKMYDSMYTYEKDHYIEYVKKVLNTDIK